MSDIVVIENNDEAMSSIVVIENNDKEIQVVTIAEGIPGDRGIQGEKGEKGDKGDKGEQGLPGQDGKSLEFHWNGTKLGIRVEGETTYQYVDLKGDKGDVGDDVIPVASSTILGGIKVGENLKIDENGVLSVDTATVVEQDNTKPVTSAAVHVQLGNVEALLSAL